MRMIYLESINHGIMEIVSEREADRRSSVLHEK